MKYDTLKALVNAKVYENTEQRITGGDMNDVLQSAIASLGAHYQMGGLVSPTDQITVGDEPVVFLATTHGTYTYFGGLVVADGEVALLVWSGTAWSKQTPDIATRTEVSQLGQNVDSLLHSVGDSLFDASQAVTGRGYNTNLPGFVNNTILGTFNLSVKPGDVVILSGYSKGLSPYGYCINNAGGSRVTDGIITGNMPITIPANGATLIITYYLADQSNVAIYKNTIVSDLATINSDIASVNEKIANEKEGIMPFYSDNLFDASQTVTGRGYHTGSHSFISNDAFGTFQLSVSPGNVVILSGYSNTIKPYGYLIRDADGHRVTDGIITGNMLITIPANGVSLIITYILANLPTIKKSLDILDYSPQIDANTDAIGKMKKNVPIKLKDFADSLRISGYRYCAFFSGVTFNGKEYHICRDAGGHLALSSYPDTALVLFEIDANGNRTMLVPSIDYSTLNGEPRDPNISVSRDGAYLLMSAFCCDPNNQSAVCGSYLFIFDQSLNLVKTIDLWAQGMRNVWGNTLQTPDGYLLKCSYTTTDGVDYLSLWKSNEKISDTLNLTFTKVYDFPTSGLGLNEATIGYVGEKLVMVSRVHNSTSVLYTTSDLGGETGWGEAVDLGLTIHSPVIPLYQKGNVFAFGGGFVVSTTIRQPGLVYYDIAAGVIKTANVIDSTLTSFGGYPSMVQIEDNVWGMMYYDDYQNASTAVYYQRVNARYACNLNFC